MKILKYLIPLLLASCAGARPREELQLDTSPTVAESAQILYQRLPLRQDLFILDADLLAQGLFGQSWSTGDAYVIELDRSLPEVMRVAVLIHEYAHVLVWNQGEDPQDQHGEAWGKAYSLVFQKWSGVQ
jgi:hypothetical protein